MRLTATSPTPRRNRFLKRIETGLSLTGKYGKESLAAAFVQTKMPGKSRTFRRGASVAVKGLDACGKSATASNNGMHPTADTLLVINSRGSGRRVMPGVRFLSNVGPVWDGSSG